MCGAALDSSQKGAEAGEEVKKPSRVRQRTMSQPQSELASTAGKIRDESESSVAITQETRVEAPTMDSHSAAGDALDNADPLGAYIEEVEVEGGPGGNGRASAAAEPDRSEEEVAVAVGELSGTESGGEDRMLNEERTEEESRAETKPGEIFEERKVDETAGGLTGGKREESSFQPIDEGKSRVIIESGARRSGRSGGLSFTRAHEERRAGGVRGEEQAGSAVASEAGAARRSGGAERQGDREGAGMRRDDSYSRRREEHNFERRERQQMRQARTPTSAGEAQETWGREKTVAGAKPVEAMPGRLFGWLVSYSDPNGLATELREGRFFVSRSSLKGNDLLLEDPSVSTPHALVNVSVSDGLRIQDLMSERGVFVRRRNADTYQRVTETVRVEHGEWLRFGDVEFLVSLVAQVGVK